MLSKQTDTHCRFFWFGIKVHGYFLLSIPSLYSHKNAPFEQASQKYFKATTEVCYKKAVLQMSVFNPFIPNENTGLVKEAVCAEKKQKRMVLQHFVVVHRI